MTDRGAGALERDADHLRIGPSSVTWEDGTAVFRIDERAWPHMSRIRGEVRVTPEALTETIVELDPEGRHLWRPYGPRSRFEVRLESPKLEWDGHGYLDGNFGSAPLEADFLRWDWCRAPLEEGAAILYEATARDGSTRAKAIRFDGKGHATAYPNPPKADLGPGLIWRVARQTRSEGRAKVIRRFEDSPFYTRELIETRLCGQDVTAVHETLDCRRFASPITKLMLPFRVPRRP